MYWLRPAPVITSGPITEIQREWIDDRRRRAEGLLRHPLPRDESGRGGQGRQHAGGRIVSRDAGGPLIDHLVQEGNYGVVCHGEIIHKVCTIGSGLRNVTAPRILVKHHLRTREGAKFASERVGQVVSRRTALTDAS